MNPVVQIVDWSPDWAKTFERDRQELAVVLPADATIEHVGSTSVPGLAAKPTVDILVVTEHVPALRDDPSRITALGYEFRPWVFEDDPDHLFFVRNTDGRRTEHLHVFHPRSPRPKANRDFRDYLIAHPAEAARYAEAKRISAAANPDSRRDYGLSKQEIVDDIQQRATGWAARR